MKAHEDILMFYDKLPTYNPIKTDGHKRKVVMAAHQKSVRRVRYTTAKIGLAITTPQNAIHAVL